MTSAAQADNAVDHTELRFVLRGALILGVIQTVLVFGFAMASRAMESTPELLVRSLIVLVGVGVTTLLPGLLTRPRTIEGIAGAAGMGLGATVVFLVLDVAILQRIGTYTNRWLQIGGGSNWWYHPVWWMVGTYLAWMGAFALSNQENRGGASPVMVLLQALVFTAGFGVLAVLVGIPFAGWNLGTFAVAFLPAIALTVVTTGLGERRA